jgi:hypothetical protein
MRKAWNDFWFRPVPRTAFSATRVILALQALWIILSRPDLPEFAGWPEPFWVFPRSHALRHGITRSVPLETGLYLILIVALIAAAIGAAERWSCLTAGLLLYHFAPMEELVTGGGLIVFRGLTQSALCLPLLALVSRPKPPSPSWEYRWPVAAAQFAMALTYFHSGLGKLHEAGLSWMEAGNIRATAMSFFTWGIRAPWAPWLIDHPHACGAIAVGTMVFELAFPIVLFSRRAAMVMVPLALVAHFFIVFMLGINFLSAFLLLLFVDWQAIGQRLGYGASTTAAPIPASR